MIQVKGYYIAIEVFTGLIAAGLVVYEANWVWGLAAFFALMTNAPERTFPG